MYRIWHTILLVPSLLRLIVATIDYKKTFTTLILCQKKSYIIWSTTVKVSSFIYVNSITFVSKKFWIKFKHLENSHLFHPLHNGGSIIEVTRSTEFNNSSIDPMNLYKQFVQNSLSKKRIRSITHKLNILDRPESNKHVTWQWYNKSQSLHKNQENLQSKQISYQILYENWD